MEKIEIGYQPIGEFKISVLKIAVFNTKNIFSCDT